MPQPGKLRHIRNAADRRTAKHAQFEVFAIPSAPPVLLLSADDQDEWNRAVSTLDYPVDWPERMGAISLNGTAALDTIARLRAQGHRVLALAGRSRAALRRSAWEAGVDELLVTGPIAAAELKARLDFLAGRNALPPDFLLDRARKQLRIGDHAYPLSSRETDLLAMLQTAAGGVVPHDALLKEAWGANATGQREYLRVAIRKLRLRIEPHPDLPRYLLSEPGVGYRIGNGMVTAPA